MYFTKTLFLSALSISNALAAKNSSSTTTTTTHVVRVSSANGTQKYFPDNLTAAVGDVIQFQFAGGNHTVTQSTFDAPCVPISQSTNTTGVFSGFMNVAAGNSTGMVPVFSMPVKVKTPLWFYCSQAKHCQNGMVLVVNENTTANASRSLSNFAALAAKAPANLFPTLNGTSSTSTTTSSSSSNSNSGTSSSSSGSSNSGSSNSGSAGSATTLTPSASSGTSSSNSGESSGSGSATSSTALASATTNAGARFGVQNVVGYVGVLGMGAWVLL